MRRRGFTPRRSAAEWIVRAALALLVAMAGYVSVTRTLAYVLRGTDVELAHRLAPEDGRITGLLAQTLSASAVTGADRARADTLARKALAQDPASSPAAAALGLDAQGNGDTARARRLFAYAEALSRRDLATQLWAVEDAVGRGDVLAALRHYDIALRVYPGASDTLFPVLASAMTGSAILSALTETLARRPAWGESFVYYVASRGPNPRATARLLLGLTRKGVTVPGQAEAATINGLVAGGEVGDAWTYYAAIRPGAERHMSRDPRFTADLADPTPFDWTPTESAGITASIQRGGKSGVFVFSAVSTAGGPLLQQLLTLPPGSYRLEGHGAGIDQPAESRPYWMLGCRGGAELGRVVMPNSAQASGVFVGRFVVPAGCPVQVLTLMARPSDMTSGLSGEIDRARLVPGS